LTQANGSTAPQSLLDRLVAVATLVTCAVVLAAFVMRWTRTPPTMAVPKAPQSLDALVTRGDVAAKLAVIVYEDSHCPACGRFWMDVMPALEERYVQPGLVRIALSSVPLRPAAWPAAQSVACANRQGRGWEMQDLLFRKQQTLDKAFDRQHYRQYGESLGFDVTRFEECLPAEGRAEVSRQLSNATALGLLATPTFVIGRMRSDGTLDATDVLQGLRPVEEFAKVFDRLTTDSPWYVSPVGLTAGALASVFAAFAGTVWIRRRKRGGPQLA
jgi:protein-disulfide isomerase